MALLQSHHRLYFKVITSHRMMTSEVFLNLKKYYATATYLIVQHNLGIFLFHGQTFVKPGHENILSWHEITLR